MNKDPSSKSSSSKGKSKAKSSHVSVELENQFILRLPENYARVLREDISNGTLKDKLSLEMHGDSRNGTVRFRNTSLSAKLRDLPCIVESWKTLDKKSFWKASDICQVLICKDDDASESSSGEEDTGNADPFKKQQVPKKYQYPHGLTPPLKNVRKKRFRKTAKKKYIEAPEIEKEVKRLLRADISAVDVTYEVLQDEDKQEDARSVASDLDVGTSMVPSPSNLNDDSMQYAGSEDIEVEENAILPDISSSEEEVDMNEFDTISKLSKDSLSTSLVGVPSVVSDDIARRVRELQQTLIDVQAKRSEQEMRVDSAANPFLKQRFQGILDGLLQKESAIIHELQELQSNM
eukprot:Seg1806.8 transcript_id=Seg1806.8/GoldUCD/mRNA.D3Y31 product="Transcription initiation factor TFIID subunit 7" protein_id=Seg1806.8/GoldUCD/D3Y31